MKINTRTIVRNKSDITLSPEEKFWYKPAWYRRKRWVNMITVEDYGFEMYGSTDRHEDDALLRIHRDNWQNTILRSPDETPNMPTSIRMAVLEEMAKLQALAEQQSALRPS